VTNFHVVQQGRVSVTLSDQSDWDARVVETAPEKDLAPREPFWSATVTLTVIHQNARCDVRVALAQDEEARMQGVKDSAGLYEVERRVRHAERPDFHITELQISATQQVPWHSHTNVQDTFYVLEGELRIFLREPKEDVRLRPGETYAVRPKRPHLVTNAGPTSATFLVLQGLGEYDYVPLT